MTPEAISAIAGIILALGFEYIPYLHGWYNAQDDNKQRLLMLAALFVTVAGALGLSCIHWLDVFTCDQPGLKEAIFSFVAALVTNQSTHRLLPRKTDEPIE